MTINATYAQELALVREKGKFGYINKEGTFVIEPKFKQAKSFSNGVALVLVKDKWGYILPNGEWAIEPQFDGGKKFNSEIGIVRVKKDWIYINKKGERLKFAISDKLYNFNDGVAFIRKPSGIGVINTKGEVVIEPKYKIIKKFKNGYARFCTHADLWGIINTKGDIIIKPVYKKIGNYVNNIARVTNSDLTQGLVSTEGLIVIPEVQKIWDFNENESLAMARKNDKIGFINARGEWVITPQFKKAKSFVNGYAGVFNDKYWGVIDSTGKLILDYQYRDVDYFSKDGLLPVKFKKDKKKWGFVSIEGKEVIQPLYEITSTNFGFLTGKRATKGFKNGLARVKHAKKWGFLKLDGSILGNKWYDNAELFVKID